MKKKTGKIIEIVLLIAGILLTAAIVVTIPLKSYHEYAAYLENLLELSKPEPKPVLESLSVSLKEGVRYYKNDLAEQLPCKVVFYDTEVRSYFFSAA